MGGMVVGLMLGTAAMGIVFGASFKAYKQIIPVILLLYACNALGYFVGDYFERNLRGKNIHTLMTLIWAVSYGAGFGAGLGCSFYLLQSRAREILRSSQN